MSAERRLQALDLAVIVRARAFCMESISPTYKNCRAAELSPPGGDGMEDKRAVSCVDECGFAARSKAALRAGGR